MKNVKHNGKGVVRRRNGERGWESVVAWDKQEGRKGDSVQQEAERMRVIDE